MDNEKSLSALIGKGYNSFWHNKNRYRVVKGGRGSKKSTTTAIYYIYNMMMYYHKYNVKPNLLVIRRYYNTHKHSTHDQLIWAIEKLGVRHLWKCPKGDNELTYIPSGQKIIFKGLDDPMSITSITVESGNLCWVWFEEAYQIECEDDFNKVDMSIRGELPYPLFKQLTLTFNPWSNKHWLKKRFFDIQDENVFTLTTTYMNNEFLSEDDLKMFEIMKAQNPKRYEIEGLGNWGISEGLIYENWHIEDFDMREILNEHIKEKDSNNLPNFVSCHGMDFGYNDPTAFIGAYADKNRYKIYIFYEFYEVSMENKKIAQKLITDGFSKSIIRADSEDPRTINELRLLGLLGIRGARKGTGSVLGGIQKLQDYEFIVHPRCVHFIEEISNYVWKKDKLTDKFINEPEHEFSHLMDAIRYGCEDLRKFGVIV